MTAVNFWNVDDFGVAAKANHPRQPPACYVKSPGALAFSWNMQTPRNTVRNRKSMGWMSKLYSKSLNALKVNEIEYLIIFGIPI